MYVYERVVLKTFSQIDAVIKNIGNASLNKAVNSFADLRPAEIVADEILQRNVKVATLHELKDAIEKSIKRLKPDHSYLLSVHYGIKTDGCGQLVKDRNYYRRIAVAIGKFSEEMKKLGYNDKRYSELCNGFSFISNAYKRAKALNQKVLSSKEYRADKSFK